MTFSLILGQGALPFHCALSPANFVACPDTMTVLTCIYSLSSYSCGLEVCAWLSWVLCLGCQPARAGFSPGGWSRHLPVCVLTWQHSVPCISKGYGILFLQNQQGETERFWHVLQQSGVCSRGSIITRVAFHPLFCVLLVRSQLRVFPTRQVQYDTKETGMRWDHVWWVCHGHCVL